MFARRLILALVMPFALIAGAVWAGEGALIDARDLALRPGLVALDIRPRAAFARGHLPGAVNLPWGEGTWQVTRYGLPGMAPDPVRLSRDLGQAGLSDDMGLLVVGAGGTSWAAARAARVFWSLRLVGHARLYLLDGGMAGLGPDAALETGAGRARRGARYQPRPDASVLAILNDVEDAMGDNRPPIDARSRAAFEGHEKAPGVKSGGTIYDAVNVPGATMLEAASGRFRPADELEGVLRHAGAVTGRYRPAVVFSDFGLRAALVWFALHEVMGLDNARLYDGSLAQWARDDLDMYDSTDGMGGVIGG